MNTFPYTKAVAACELNPDALFIATVNGAPIVAWGSVMVDLLSSDDTITTFHKGD